MCTVCVAGRSSPSSVAPECTACPSGYYESKASKPNCTRCANCTLGTRQVCGNSFEGYCAACAPGKYTDTVGKHCTSCPRGYYQSASGQEQCYECNQDERRYQSERGKSYCDEIPSGSALAMVASTGNPEMHVPKVFICPAVGVNCKGVNVAYTGGVWHGIVEVAPNCTDSEPSVCTRFYTCVNNGKYILINVLHLLCFLRVIFYSNRLSGCGCEKNGV